MLSYLPPDHKSCNVCGETKPAAEFYKSKHSCKACFLVACKDRYAGTAEQKREYQREYGRKNAEKRAAYRARTRERIAEYNAEWYRLNRDARAEYHKEYRAANPEMGRKHRQLRRARKLSGVVDRHVSAAWLRARDGDNCHYCAVAMVFEGDAPNRAHVEHKIPLSRGGLHSESNCVLACRDCNLHKRDMTDVEFTERAMK